MPALVLRRQLAATPSLASSSSSPSPVPSPSQANTDATRFLPSQTSAPDNADSGGTTFDIWKYIVVIVLACFAVSVVIRICVVQRYRRNRLLAFQAAEDRRFAQRRRARQRDLHRVDSTASSRADSVLDADLGGADDLPPPPAYDQTTGLPPTATTPTVAPPPPARPTPFSRLSSLFKRGPAPSAAAGSGGALPLQPLPSPSDPRPNTNRENHATPPARAPQPSTLAQLQVQDLRRTIRAFAGTGTGTGRSAVDDDDDDAAEVVSAARRRREERRARRRERERRRRERERDEGAGLPTYSREAGEGEEVLQRAERVKDGDEDEDGASSGEESDAPGDEGEQGADAGETGAARARRVSIASGSGGGSVAVTPRATEPRRDEERGRDPPA